ncbi:ATP-binding protein [Spirillospora sp. NPDC048823]|uniref:sensor histidine kinase n=1 Tax=unclassified Spirillospora TaxID=2642701 RepID=UPI00371AE8AB
MLIDIMTCRSEQTAPATVSLAWAVAVGTSAMLVLKAMGSEQALLGLLALASVGAVLLCAGVLTARSKALRIAERLLELPHLGAAHRVTGEDLVSLTGDLRWILGSDELWLYITLPGGEVWTEASADVEALRTRTPYAHERFKRLSHRTAGCIPRVMLPNGWRVGVHIPIRTPDGLDAGYLLLGWTRLGGRHLAAWTTTGVLGRAVNRAARALGTLRDEAYAAHRAEAERSRLSAVVDDTDVAVLALDGEGSIIVWNVAMAQLVGVTANGALGRRPEDLFTLTGEEGAVGLAPGLRGSVRLTTPGGRSSWIGVSCSAAPETAAPGLLTAVFVDESAQRQVEYTRHLLLTSAHHELHGPLTAIRGHGQLLEEVLPDDETVAASLGAILDSEEMMHRIIADLVHVVGPDPTAPPATTVRPVELEPLLRRTLRSVPSVAQRAVVTAQCGLTVQGDPLRLRQCLLLVLGNAQKYAPDGKIDITMSRQGSSGVISITDEGPGLAPGEHELAREPYYRSSTVRDRPGSGMGLYIADTVMTAMKGRVEITAAPSGGLDVRFLLPLSPDPGEDGGALVPRLGQASADHHGRARPHQEDVQALDASAPAPRA